MSKEKLPKAWDRFIKDALAKKIESGDITKAEAFRIISTGNGAPPTRYSGDQKNSY